MEIWENNNENWRLGKITPRGSSPEQGDIVVFYYAETHAFDCGIVGWGIVLRYDPVDRNDKTIKEMRFRVASPSDYLKMSPLYNKNIEDVIDEIRGNPKQGTLWVISEKQMNVIRKEITLK
jgi:hypothetical protein